MTKFTPTTIAIRNAWREYNIDLFAEEADEEFSRWLAAHDQGIRDAVKVPEETAWGHLQSAWDAAYPTVGKTIPANTAYLFRQHDGGMQYKPAGGLLHIPGSEDIRTIEPLPPVIPDDCEHVWATFQYGTDEETREIWTRIGSDRWVCNITGTAASLTTSTADLIDPKPVPEEQR